MKPRLSHKTSRNACSLGLAALMAASSLASATPALARNPVSTPPSFDRKEAMRRADSWTRPGIPYSQLRSYKGYRTDCSGFVSMVWDLKRGDGKKVSLTTWTIPTVARPISKGQLQPGDVLLNKTANPNIRHVVVFGGWLNKAKTRYRVYEQVGSVGRAISRPMVYPYRITPGMYRPYRYVGTPRAWRAPSPAEIRRGRTGRKYVRQGTHTPRPAEIRRGRTGRKYVRQGTHTPRPAEIRSGRTGRKIVRQGTHTPSRVLRGRPARTVVRTGSHTPSRLRRERRAAASVADTSAVTTATPTSTEMRRTEDPDLPIEVTKRLAVEAPLGFVYQSVVSWLVER